MLTKQKYKKEITNITKQVIKKHKPEKIILFGSFAYGKPTSSSDVDMLIIKNSKKKRAERIFDVLITTETNLPFEPLVYTPEEVNSRMQLGDFFIQNIIKKGQVLYER